MIWIYILFIYKSLIAYAIEFLGELIRIILFYVTIIIILIIIITIIIIVLLLL